MQRLGLFGGSFNPVTWGHLLVARAALEELNLDRLFFIPAAQSPFKPGQQMASGDTRLRLLRLALAGQTDFDVDDQELRRGGISYTIDTLRNYSERFPGAELFYLVGGDHAASLPLWHRAPELARLAEFVILLRPGSAPPQIPPPFRGRILHGIPFAVSASMVRARLRAGLPVDGLVPDAVAEALGESRIYG